MTSYCPAGMVSVTLALCCSIARGGLPADGGTLDLYPHTSAEQPNVPSPWRRLDRMEVIVAFTKEGRYVVVARDG